MEEKAAEPQQAVASTELNDKDIGADVLINASGHEQELERNFHLINICGLAVTSGNTWIALGGSIVVAIYNGGPPGVIYELYYFVIKVFSSHLLTASRIAASVFYWLIAASIAELASAIPSSGGGSLHYSHELRLFKLLG